MPSSECTRQVELWQCSRSFSVFRALERYHRAGKWLLMARAVQERQQATLQ